MNEKFSYTYSAKTHAEVEKIRQKYAAQPPADDKLEQLRRLDKSCELPGTITAVIVGTAGTIVLGTGLALILKTSLFVLGLIIGVIGLSIMTAALPVHRYVTEQRRRELAPEILRLSEEIENGPSA